MDMLIYCDMRACMHACFSVCTLGMKNNIEKLIHGLIPYKVLNSWCIVDLNKDEVFAMYGQQKDSFFLSRRLTNASRLAMCI